MVVTSSRAAVIRYKKGFDAYIAKHPEHAGIRSLIAFSGTMTGKQVKHLADETLSAEEFLIDDNEEFSELIMNPEVTFAGTPLVCMTLAKKRMAAALSRLAVRKMSFADQFYALAGPIRPA